MSGEVLRRAAALMRERAEAAVAEEPKSAEGWYVHLGPAGTPWVNDKGGHLISTHGYPRHAEHIASWHPAVALAVADWLERLHDFLTSGEYDQDADLLNALDGVTDAPPLSDWPEVESALAVARAYLGEQP